MARLSKNDALFAKCRSTYAHLLDIKDHLEQQVGHLADNIGMKKGDLMILIKAEGIAGECKMTTLQLDMFDEDPAAPPVARIVPE